MRPFRAQPRNPPRACVLETEMDATITTALRRRVLVAIALAAALTAGAVVAGSPPAADGVAAKTLGQTNGSPEPACPGRPSYECQAVGSVTGFQRVAKGRRSPFRARENGHLVAWSMKLANPNAQEERFFGNFFESQRFGNDPSARIAVIRRQQRLSYKLKRQSPAISLDGLQDDRKHFITLNDPLRFREGDVIAITVPTWAAFFAHGLSRRNNTWRSSRRPGKCNRPRDIKDGRPHQKVGTDRVYGCDYNAARLLYWGHYVPR
jgi:hypothetical protein